MMFLAPVRHIDRVFLHCSASDRPEDDNAATIRQWHLARGFSDIGYHFYIRKDGTVERGRGIEITPAAQEGQNRNTIAVCLGGLRDFTEFQFQSLRNLCGQIHAAVPAATFHGHKEVNPAKTCPVYDYRAVLCLDGDGRMPPSIPTVQEA